MLVKPYVKQYHLKLTFEDHLMLVLMKAKLGLLNKGITIHFNINKSRLSNLSFVGTRNQDL